MKRFKGIEMKAMRGDMEYTRNKKNGRWSEKEPS